MTSPFRKVRWLWSRERKRAELEDELRFHLEEERDEREAAGATRSEAERQAQIDFGNLAVAREDTRAVWGWRLLEQLGGDLAYALRTMRRSPGFALMAVLSLALGIGVNTAIFSFTDAMLLQDLPVHDPSQLVRMRWETRLQEMHGTSRHDSSVRDQPTAFTGGVFSYAAFDTFRQRSDLFESVFAYQGTGLLTVAIHGQADSANGEYVSGNYFHALGVAPGAGRGFDGRDDEFGAPAVAVVSYSFSARRFSHPADAIGQTCAINATPFTIVGVMPAGFFGTDPGKAVDIYVPLHANILVETSPRAARAIFTQASTWWLEIMARRRPGVRAAQIQAVLAPPFKQVSDGLATQGRWHQAPVLEVIDGGDGIDGLRRAYGKPLFLLTVLAGLILALACTNIANLLLARSGARSREIAVRLSLGAGRPRIVRQLVTESVLLSCLGGATGALIAFWTESWVAARLSNEVIPLGVSPALSWEVLGVAIGLSLATGLLFGLAPALQATRPKTMAALRDHRSVSSRVSRRRGRPRQLLLAGQIAMTLVMLIAAGLFIRTLRNYGAIDPGFSSARVLTFVVRADQAGLDQEHALVFYRALRERLAALPGIESVAMSDLAIIGDGQSFDTVEPIGRSLRESSLIVTVDGGFFSTMRVPIARGRPIRISDDAPGAEPVVVVDETYARRYLSDVDPLTQHVRVPGVHEAGSTDPISFAVVGVARSVRVGTLTGSEEPTVYFPFTTPGFGRAGRMVYELRTSGDPMAYAGLTRQAVRETNAGVPIIRMASQDALIESTISREALLARLCAMFAGLALAIAVVGLYGTVLHDVSRRRAEIGVRMALGARRAQVIAMVLRDVLIVVAMGLAIGVPAAVSATRISESLLFGVTRSDPSTTVLAMTVLVATALLSAFAPALRAANVSPVVALRND